jgi:hypothetical protein
MGGKFEILYKNALDRFAVAAGGRVAPRIIIADIPIIHINVMVHAGRAAGRGPGGASIPVSDIGMRVYEWIT